jgi:hypothetical protein
LHEKYVRIQRMALHRFSPCSVIRHAGDEICEGLVGEGKWEQLGEKERRDSRDRISVTDKGGASLGLGWMPGVGTGTPQPCFRKTKFGYHKL